ncbi:MAG TPA: oxidoreductase [Cyanobacteria bacterium UBA8553]|nr:oxidoreductase [Cyanobacteria bacterium UBA8553]HAJ63328.1 oxidoreductase [Cyanobacteria bacterium UBA8543]
MAPTLLITGASEGIGKATARVFAQHGYNVVLAAREPQRLNSVAQEISAQGGNALAVPTDVTDPQQVNTLVERALTAYSQIDVLVNNAGICSSGLMEKTSLEDWHKVIDVNLWGYVHTIQALLPHFLERRAGTIVNVGSFGGKVPLPNMTLYCTSKYAITGLTETLRLELEPKGIQVCGVHPSATKTGFIKRSLFRGRDEQETNQRQQQMKQFIESPFASKSEDVAKAIWDVVKHPQAEVVVGTAAAATAAYRFAPGLMSWILQRTLKA